jgi:hypothetical protein
MLLSFNYKSEVGFGYGVVGLPGLVTWAAALLCLIPKSGKLGIGRLGCSSLPAAKPTYYLYLHLRLFTSTYTSVLSFVLTPIA